MRQTLFDYCIENDTQYLLEQWVTEKNDNLTPKDITFGSSRKMWWRCREGHEWQAAVHTRTSQRSNCPYCAGKKASPGHDLASRFPNLVKQWHTERNGDLTPSQVMPGSHVPVWWRCEKGHEWRAAIKSRAGGTGCPYCSNRKIIVGVNDLATTHPQLAQEWHTEKNYPLTPQQVVQGNVRKVWWKCSAGHEWQAQIAPRAAGNGCPYCSNKKIIPGENDLASGNPFVASQWLQEKNGTLTPEQVSPYSNKRVWWRCSLGHEWQNTIASRVKSGNGCPVCAGKIVLPGFNDLKSQMPEIAKDWHSELNGKLTAEMVTVGSSQRVWWQCPYGHVWKAQIASRTGKTKSGCPACAGKVNQAKQRYYAELESEGFLKKQLAEDTVPDDVWDCGNGARSLAGKSFGRWTVLQDAKLGPRGIRQWLCRCQCGTEKYVSERSLLEGKSQSCGCFANERLKEALTHDLLGRQFQDLTVIGRAETPKGKKGVWWRCRCVCGNELDVLAANLTAGRRTNCGCIKKTGNIKDLTGQQFGMLTVLEPTEKRTKNGSVIWACQCACGTITEQSSIRLQQGKALSCGCQTKQKRIKDLVGQRFGQLTVVRATKKRTSGGYVIWTCRCDCGNEIDVSGLKLQKGAVQSCGCSDQRKRYKDLAGQQFGMLVAKYATEVRTKRGSVVWICQCACGNEVGISSDRLIEGKATHCGCQPKRRKTRKTTEE